MIDKLPRWVWTGGCVLAFIAGIVNAVGYLGFLHQAVTHLTGGTTVLGLAVAHRDQDQALHLLGTVAAFVAGCAFSGALVRDATLKLGRRYGVVLVTESMLFVGAAQLLMRGRASGDHLAIAACGMQNAMATTYSGAVLRTTHVSGIFTDLGVGLGQWIARAPVDRLRMLLSALILTSFFTGVVVGALLFTTFGFGTLYLPAALTGVAGAGYMILNARERHRAA